ncbi:uncharacterized protein BP01DRAFT_136085 [Aspergillus saccharolyticus JOP 1030-1]|uniref:Uncharacterized protein n=1 Tax=Aspergillus saccharolyticus JOP 1030-1 TaxID=1450539 RepID=A0A318ZF86_9EURO|nr:hypothetical protein BP01DRAFT_136085 [Aspergillus saccharolyticus JOP 1030-1]PYH42270.1 hypothetical protein BP01DRAFT_136085 [Aspergillus saccharolyticus JOP 1030-1]
MKSFTAIIASLLIASVSAAPAPVEVEARQVQTTTVSLSNDQTGANAGVAIPVDGTFSNIFSLYGGTAVGASGQVIVSNAQLTNNFQGVTCLIFNNGNLIGTLNDRQTAADLDGNPNGVSPFDLSGGFIACF